MKFYIGDTVD